jgi:hypothetical protein
MAGAPAAATPGAPPAKNSKLILYGIGALVVLVIIGIVFYEYEYGTSCVWKHPSTAYPSVDSAGYCVKDNSYSNKGKRLTGSGHQANMGACAAKCNSTPTCNGFIWNLRDGNCILLNYATKMEATKSPVPDGVGKYFVAAKKYSKSSPFI